MTYVGVFGDACLVCLSMAILHCPGSIASAMVVTTFYNSLPGRDILFLSQKYIYMRNN